MLSGYVWLQVRRKEQCFLFTIWVSPFEVVEMGQKSGLVNAGKREKSERGEKPKACQREGEEEAGVARKSIEQGKRHRGIESVGQDTYRPAAGNTAQISRDEKTEGGEAMTRKA